MDGKFDERQSEIAKEAIQELCRGRKCHSFRKDCPRQLYKGKIPSCYGQIDNEKRKRLGVSLRDKLSKLNFTDEEVESFVKNVTTLPTMIRNDFQAYENELKPTLNS